MSAKPSIGDRVKVTGILPHDPAPLTVGLEGTVDWVGNWTDMFTQQFSVEWDDGRTLGLLAGDPYEVLR